MSRLPLLAPLAALSLITLAGATSATAQTTQIRVLRPETRIAPPVENLPRFGFESYNIEGYGERVTRVRHFGLAAEMGLEPGDVILRMNHIPLTYHGAWNDALREALVNHEGKVRLSIRDVRTGAVVQRVVFVGGQGPITPKSHGPHDHVHHNHGGHNHGPQVIHSHERRSDAPRPRGLNLTFKLN